MSIVKEFNLLLRRTRGSASLSPFCQRGWLLKRVSVAVLVRDESYGHEDPSRAPLASEKALSTRVLVSSQSY